MEQNKPIIQIAIVGAGPSGLFTAQALTQKIPNCHIHILEKLPVPYGLLRYGVAPDHEKLKNTYRFFQKFLSESNQVSLYCNTRIGEDITPTELHRKFDITIYCYGAENGKKLGVPGENATNIYTSESVVGWYNSHPDYAQLAPFQTAKNIAIIGLGNVAIDIARIVTLDSSLLNQTDIAHYAYQTIQNIECNNIYIFGRKGPIHAAFSYPMLKELIELDSANIAVNLNDIHPDPPENLSGPKQKSLELFRELANTHPKPGRPTIHFKFFHAPISFDGHQTATHINCQNTKEHWTGTKWEWHKKDQISTYPIDNVITCLGYKGKPIEELPFDTQKSIIPNQEGRVLHNNQPLPGVYACGWIKRGATGVIGSNKKCAKETVEQIIHDLNAQLTPKQNTTSDIIQFINQKNPNSYNIQQINELDQYEQDAGKPYNKCRLNFHAPESINQFLTQHQKQ